MKKFILTTIAVFTFSLTSFANESENKKLVTPINEVTETELINTAKDDLCFDVTIRWTTAESYYDDEYGMEGVLIQAHVLSFTICF